jgi:RNA polymerase I-specific transcription initiation factor RRN3
LEELEEMEPSQEADPVFELDPFDTIIGQEADDTDSEAQEEDDDDDDHFSDLSSDAGDEGEEELVDVPSNLRHVRDMVKKLDVILKLLFDHFNHIHAAMLAPPPLPSIPSRPPESTNPPRTSSPLPPSPEATKLLCRSHFQTLLSIFDRTIIRTFKSRYTQFLVFWYASLDSEFSDLFQGLLVSKALLEHEQPIVTRAAAACYIASFISRARFVDREGARRVTSMLCHFLTNHLDTFDGVVQAGTPLLGQAHHDMFYAVVQSVFLIFCFRWRDLMEEQEEDGEVSLGPKTKKIWMAELNVVHRAVHSQLNPLKVTQFCHD